MVDKIKPLKIETTTDGSQSDPFPTEVNPTQDYLSAKGIAFNNSDNTTITESSGEVFHKDVFRTTPKTLRELVNFDSYSYAPAISSNNNSYTIVGRIHFLGTTYYKSPVKIQAIMQTSVGVIGNIRLYDVTNAKVIVEKTGIPANTSPTIFDLGVISNLPVSEAIFEIQMQRTSGLTSIYCHSIVLKW